MYRLPVFIYEWVLTGELFNNRDITVIIIEI